jgi:ferrochelatase
MTNQDTTTPRNLPSPHRRGILLVNIGTPDAPDTKAVRRYLRQFLSDPRVLDISAVGRFLLLNLVILPRRPAASARAYRKIWTDEGSPLLVHTRALALKLEAELGIPVRFAMRYQNPPLAEALESMADEGIDQVVVCGLYPQYASSAGGSTTEEVFRRGGERWNVPAVTILPAFYEHPGFIDAVAAQCAPTLETMKPDKLLMSFHGLPERHCTKSDPTGSHCLKRPGCCDAIVETNRHCYRAQCYATARALAARLQLQPDQWEVAFQSRLGRTPWIRPYTDVRLQELPQEGVKRVAVVCPAFVADCLETLEEIAIRAAQDFKAHGGDELRLIPCVNSTDTWVQGLARIIRDHTPLP